ncbi:MAG: aminoglycoside phosphotransferase family protein [Candidatus Kaiserbacteria bacterium]|nr:aminoglycoside phosphotransferase family protein [Candidatus Kaiserbacteria bacterium]
MEAVHTKNIDFLEEYLTNQQFDWVNYDFEIDISYFTSGGGTHLYLIKNGKDRFLARINFYPGKNEWGVKKTEFETLKAIEVLCIAPKAFALCTDNSLGQDFTIVEYVEGENVKRFEDERIKMLANDLHKLHDFKIPDLDNNSVSYICDIYNEFSQGTDKQIEQYEFDGRGKVAPLYNEIKNDLGIWFNGLTIFSDSKNICLCHADLKSENILVTSTGIKLIDWECAGTDIPETDIGRLFSGCEFTNEQQHLFLSEYYQTQPNDIILNKILAVRTVLDFFRIIEDYCIHKRKILDASSMLSDLQKFKSTFNQTRNTLSQQS